MNNQNDSQKKLAIKIASTATDVERDALLRWTSGLLEIRDSSLPAIKKGKQALQLTLNSEVIWPTTKIIGREIKRLTWDERGAKGRLSIAGVVIGATVFSGQGAGIAALGTAVGVPLWVVLGAGGAFAGMLIEELTPQKHQSTEYTVIEAEKSGENQNVLETDEE